MKGIIVKYGTFLIVPFDSGYSHHALHTKG